MKRFWLISILLGFGMLTAFTQDSIVSIPDTTFLHILIDEGVDTDGDSLISYSEASIISKLRVGSTGLLGIEDVTGLESFINLDTLFLVINPFLDTLDFSAHKKLKSLEYSGGGNGSGIGYMNLTNNTDLIRFMGGSTSELDLSQNKKLQELIYFSPAHLDLSHNAELLTLLFGHGTQNEIDLSNNKKLLSLEFWSGNLERLDLAHNPELRHLSCEGNLLTELNLSNNRFLGKNFDEEIYHFGHGNSTISLTDMPSLQSVCLWRDADLDSLNFNTTGSPNIIFTNECENQIVYIPDSLFLFALIEEGVDTNEDSLISYSEAERIESLTIQIGSTHNFVETNLEGIDAFVNLDTLYLAGLRINGLDISNLTNLMVFSVFGGIFDELNLSQNTNLKELDLTECCVNAIDISNNKALERIYCSFSLKGGKECHDVNVCVWALPFPPAGSNIEFIGDPANFNFITDCSDFIAPTIIATDTLYQPESIEATSSREGFIYLVPSDTDKDIETIREAAIDSAGAVANTPVNISVSTLENGIYWLYAIDLSGNISEPKAFTILGVGMKTSQADHIRIFPNPANNLITIESVNSDKIRINVTSLSGQLILNEFKEGTTNQLDLSNFKKGVYFITIRSKEFVITRKIIKL